MRRRREFESRLSRVESDLPDPDEPGLLKLVLQWSRTLEHPVPRGQTYGPARCDFREFLVGTASAVLAGARHLAHVSPETATVRDLQLAYQAGGSQEFDYLGTEEVRKPDTVPEPWQPFAAAVQARCSPPREQTPAELAPLQPHLWAM